MSHLCVTTLLVSMNLLPLAMILTALIMMMFKPNDERWSSILLVELGALFFWLVIIAPLFSAFLTLHPSQARLDQYAYEIDRVFFGYPSFYAGRLLRSSPTLDFIANFAYGNMLTPIRVLILLYFLRISVPEGFKMVKAFVLNSLLCFFIYIWVPVSGPLYAFSGYPYHLPTVVTPHVILLRTFPNGVPSVHMSMALLTAFFFWRWRAGRVFGVIWISMTTLATLGLGEHYLIDLILAVPYAFGCLWLAGYDLTQARDKMKIGDEKGRAEIPSGDLCAVQLCSEQPGNETANP